MRGVMLEIPEKLLAERRRRGEDRWDEMWEGVLHMVPPPSGWHQEFGAELLMVLGPLAKARGLHVMYEAGLFRGDDDYRAPDLVFMLPAQRTVRGVEGGAELIIEIRSPNDETYEKLPFYASFGVREMLVIDPRTRDVELFVLRGGKLELTAPDEHGRSRSGVLDVSLGRVEGPLLDVRWGEGTTRL